MPGPCTPYSTASIAVRLTGQSIRARPANPMEQTNRTVNKRLAVAGSGAIACGLAATAAHHGPVLLLARSQSSADRARATVEKTLQRLGAEVDPPHAEV